MLGSEVPAGSGGVPDRLAALFGAFAKDVFGVYARERAAGKTPFAAIGWATGEVLAEADGNKVALYFTTDEGKPVLNELLSQLEQAYQELRS